MGYDNTKPGAPLIRAPRTATNITEAEIRALRHEAAEAGDVAQVVVCDIALDEINDLCDYAITTYTRDACRRAQELTRDEAIAVVVVAINDARAQ